MTAETMPADKEKNTGGGGLTKVQISVRWKALIGFTILFSIVYLIALYTFTWIALDAADSQIQADLTQALDGAAEGIDVEKLMELAALGKEQGEGALTIGEDGYTDDPRFNEIMKWLDDVHKAEPDAWPYVYVPGEEENQVYFIVDLYEKYDPEVGAGFYESYTSTGSLIRGLDEPTNRPVENRIVEDLHNYATIELGESWPWMSEKLVAFATWLDESGTLPQREFGTYGDKFGRWASGYRPLYDADGNKVAGIGVDFEAATVNEVRDAVRSQVQQAFVIAYPVLLVVVLLVLNFFVRPLLTLTSAAERVGEGDYEVDFSELISDNMRDEIDSLAAVFSIMVDKVYKREQKLKRQVAQLKIEIDEAKQSKEVSQIVDTDFFRELQDRATSLRERRQDKE